MQRSSASIVAFWIVSVVSTWADQPVPFKPGEVLTYSVSWSNIVTAGGATLAVRERRSAGGGRAAYYIVVEAKPASLLERIYHLYYKAETWLDTEALRPLHATMYSDERGRTRLRTMRFLSDSRVDYEVRTSTVTRSEFQAQPMTQDPVSALYVLRRMALKEGQSMTLPIATNGRNYRVRVRAVGREVLAMATGPTRSWRLAAAVENEDGRPATTRNVTLWLSDDARRLPLRVTVDLPVGSFIVALQSVGAM